jgi:hypothetical protein
MVVVDCNLLKFESLLKFCGICIWLHVEFTEKQKNVNGHKRRAVIRRHVCRNADLLPEV